MQKKCLFSPLNVFSFLDSNFFGRILLIKVYNPVLLLSTFNASLVPSFPDKFYSLFWIILQVQDF